VKGGKKSNWFDPNYGKQHVQGGKKRGKGAEKKVGEGGVAVEKKAVAPKVKHVKAEGTPVPESHLKHKKSADKLRRKNIRKLLLRSKKVRAVRRNVYHRAEKYEQQYRDMRKNLVQCRRFARQGGTFYVEPEAKIALVIRIRGINGVSPKVKKILRLLRLRQLHNAVFVRLNKPMHQMLTLVEAYVTYGYPTVNTIKELIYKRGFAKVQGNRLPIRSNGLIEKHLGKHNVICLEDVINQIYTCGPHFKQVNRFLWPIKLSCPRGGFVRKSTHFAEGGDAGNRETHINKLVKRMN